MPIHCSIKPAISLIKSLNSMGLSPLSQTSFARKCVTSILHSNSNTFYKFVNGGASRCAVGKAGKSKPRINTYLCEDKLLPSSG